MAKLLAETRLELESDIKSRMVQVHCGNRLGVLYINIQISNAEIKKVVIVDLNTLKKILYREDSHSQCKVNCLEV